VDDLLVDAACSCVSSVHSTATDVECTDAVNADEVSSSQAACDGDIGTLGQLCSVPHQTNDSSSSAPVQSVTDQPVMCLEQDGVVDGCKTDKLLNINALNSAEVKSTSDEPILVHTAQTSTSEASQADKSREPCCSVVEGFTCEDNIGTAITSLGFWT